VSAGTLEQGVLSAEELGRALTPHRIVDPRLRIQIAASEERTTLLAGDIGGTKTSGTADVKSSAVGQEENKE
jgi:hypothetical protein